MLFAGNVDVVDVYGDGDGSDGSLGVNARAEIDWVGDLLVFLCYSWRWGLDFLGEGEGSIACLVSWTYGNSTVLYWKPLNDLKLSLS